MLNEDQIGKRIKRLRLDRKLTQQELADIAGITKSYLSKIENSDSSPPVSTLINLAKAIGVQLDDFFNDQNPETILCVVRRDKRQKIPRKGSPFGYTYEPLAHKFPRRHMEPYWVKIPPSDNFSSVFQHIGEECLVILEGKVEFIINKQEIILAQGDSIYFDSSYPHIIRCVGPKAASCMLVIYSPEQNPIRKP